ncbi:putative D-methionine ABC transporter, ATP-binding protein [Streptomyces sp. Tu6071]|nr:putative D-methionine ABC transporter, ATP-binding protein [Streptomyces sp. Tu6071]
MPTTETRPLSSSATNMVASTRGTTSRCTGETPMTSMASSSSRILREPRSAQIAEPPAPAMSSETMSGLACWMTARTLAPPVKDCAPSCCVKLPTWSAMTAPKGIDTSAAGRMVTLAMNQNCSMNSRNWKGRRKIARSTSRVSAKSLPVWRSGPSNGFGGRGGAGGGVRTASRGTVGGSGGGAGRSSMLMRPLRAPYALSRGTPVVRPRAPLPAVGGADRGLRALGQGVQQPPYALPAPRHGGALAESGTRLQLRDERLRFGGRGGRGGLGCERRGVLLLGHPDGTRLAGGQELGDDRFAAREEHFARAEGDQFATEEHPHVVGHGRGDVEVVRDDEHRRVDAGVEVDEELGDEGGAHRVEARVGLVAQDDLRVEHEGPREARALAHPAADLAGQLALRADQADEFDPLHDDAADLGLLLAGVLAQREGDVVEEVHRPEQGPVLEHQAELLAGLHDVPLRRARHVDAVHQDATVLGLEQADQRLEEDGLARPRRTEHDADLPRRQRQADVLPDGLPAEGLRQPLDPHFDSHRLLTFSERTRQRTVMLFARAEQDPGTITPSLPGELVIR